MISSYILFGILLLAFLCSCDDLYRLELYSQERGAACLDGSPPGIYIHQGTTNKNKFMLYFDSGGFCGGLTLADTLESCYKRSFSSLGTTKKSQPFKDFTKQGLLSPVKEQNPVFYDWTKVFVIYCDGSEYLGHRQQPISYKDAKLYFRGNKNSEETFNYLNTKYDLYNQDTIVITGVSAGGMATYQWSNYLLDNSVKAKVLAIPDSGFFITDYTSPIYHQKIIRERAQNLLKLVYAQGYIPQPVEKCLKNGTFDMVDCLNSGNYIEYLRAPMLIVQSAYDEYSLHNIIGLDCLTGEQPFSIQNCNDTEMAAIEDYRKQSLQYIDKMHKTRKDISIWSPACVQHGFSDSVSFNNETYEVSGYKLSEAIQKFIDNPSESLWLLDQMPWPGNKKCSGLHKRKNLQKY